MKWQWDVLIVPLIALGVWILGTLFKGDADKSKKAPRRPTPPSGRPSRRPPATDLDRFLEEARRRREEPERPKPLPTPEHARVSRPPLRERPVRPREVPRPAPPALRSEEGLIALPVTQPVDQPLMAEPVAALPASPPPTVAPKREVSLTPIAKHVRSLLGNPRTAGTAFVLREIFDRPLCRRHRR